MSGPLHGIRIIEIAGLGPAPFCGMMLADHGAEVIRVDRIGAVSEPTDILARSRSAITLNLKSPEGVAILRQLCRTADGLIEGFRPGVMERLGLGPEVLLADNPKLVFGRMTGWGQTGPYAQAAGHDINYIALAGALHAFGRAGEKPTPPINMVGDFGGGGMMLAFGMVCAILSARQTGIGQVIDCAMTDGAAVLMSMMWGFKAQGSWKDERGVNLLDTGAPFYDTYECSDGSFISIGSIEPQFYGQLLRLTGLDNETLLDIQTDPSLWPDQKARLTRLFLTRPRAAWSEILEQTDACFAPVLNMAEAPSHPHNIARRTFEVVAGHVQPMPAPRYSNTRTSLPRPTTPANACTGRVLNQLGYSEDEVAGWMRSGVVQ